MCTEISFYLQFATFMMLLATVPLAMLVASQLPPRPLPQKIRGRVKRR